MKLQCMECGKVFNYTNNVEECPKCGSVDLEPASAVFTYPLTIKRVTK